MSNGSSDITYGRFQLTSLVVLRMLVAWHFLYEGIAKILNPYWTSAGYLQASQGPFADWFIGLATNPARERPGPPCAGKLLLF